MEYSVMVVEDELESLLDISALVEVADPEFHVVAKAFGGEEALQLLDIVEPLVIVTDIEMPIINGLELLRQAQTRGWQGQALLISGHDKFEYAQEAIPLGVVEYILKPVSPAGVAKGLAAAKAAMEKRTREADEIRKEVIRQLHSDDRTGMGQMIPAYVVTAMKYVDIHFAERITLKDAAKAAGVTPTYLSSKFSEYCGCNFVEYLTKRRLDAARGLLVNTELQVQEIGDRVGYPETAYFSRVFRQAFKVPPSEYRRLATQKREAGDS